MTEKAEQKRCTNRVFKSLHKPLSYLGVELHADTSVHPDLLNSRFAYVSVSRASHDAVVFTDDVAKLVPQLGADVSKTSALEINQCHPAPKELSWGCKGTDHSWC